MKQVDLSNAAWRKSSYSSGNGQCVEVAHIGDVVALRDSKDPTRPALVFAPREFDAFVCGVAGGEFGRS
ncbi:DUF397 domain-containing protein [Streptomyces sp. SID3212]|uniref:DUF397 domain-containing protein n=1 Tax=unclassified Streptomyces TaxID=2593676 RepID=UPI00136EEB14|nr:DUF397 domain-containing protein [Streptomyces sp. SID3212]MYV55483.1 DUF397 domain-containing protein [Streptomyces sp. SID3212]